MAIFLRCFQCGDLEMISIENSETLSCPECKTDEIDYHQRKKSILFGLSQQIKSPYDQEKTK